MLIAVVAGICLGAGPRSAVNISTGRSTMSAITREFQPPVLGEVTRIQPAQARKNCEPHSEHSREGRARGSAVFGPTRTWTPVRAAIHVPSPASPWRCHSVVGHPRRRRNEDVPHAGAAGVGAHLDARLITASSTDGTVAGAGALRTRILNADPMSPVNVVMITSPGRGEGKTLTVGNLGLAMAQEWQCQSASGC